MCLTQHVLTDRLAELVKPQTYILSSQKDTHPISRANAYVLSTAQPDKIRAAINRALTYGETARTAEEYVYAARMAFVARKRADMDNESQDGFVVAHTLALTYLTIAAELGGMDATLQTWADSRARDIVSVRIERAKNKTNNMRLVIQTRENKTIYQAVNTTAAMDYRKIDAAFNKRLAARIEKAEK